MKKLLVWSALVSVVVVGAVASIAAVWLFSHARDAHKLFGRGVLEIDNTTSETLILYDYSFGDAPVPGHVRWFLIEPNTKARVRCGGFLREQQIGDLQGRTISTDSFQCGGGATSINS